MGANLEIKIRKKASNEMCGDIYISSSELRGINVSDNIFPNIIDEILILSVAACFAEGQTVIKNAAELRVKDSDRLHANFRRTHKVKNQT
jgi:5-enolpyruvylshikimate-3-phosphate synthase